VIFVRRLRDLEDELDNRTSCCSWS